MFVGLLIVALLAVAASLFFGIVSLFKGGEFNRRYGNQAMRWRVILQAITLLVFTFVLMFAR